MKNKGLKISAVVSGALTLCFVLFTILVKFVDTAYVGITGKKIGFSSLNAAVFDRVKVSDLYDKLSDVIMIVAIILIAVAFVFAVIQLVKRKSLKKIDKELYAFAIVLVLTALVYVLFEIVDLNFRPILIEGKPEASYPSSHTMLALVVFMCYGCYFLSNAKSKNIKILSASVTSVLIVLSVLFRVLSGMHWITDIIASVILSLMLASYYILINIIIQKLVEKNGK